METLFKPDGKSAKMYIVKISGLNPKGEWDVETLREPVNIAIEAFW